MCAAAARVSTTSSPRTTADDLGDRKAGNIAASGADLVTAGNGGCLLQIGAALRRSGHPLPAFHPVELLDASIRGLPRRAAARRRAHLVVHEQPARY